MMVSVSRCVLNNVNGDPEVRVVKTLKDMRRTNPKQLLNEIQVLQELRHDNIVHFYESFISEDEIRLVIEYCRGGNLNDFISAVAYSSETAVARACYQLLYVLSYCHDRNLFIEKLAWLMYLSSNRVFLKLLNCVVFDSPPFVILQRGTHFPESLVLRCTPPEMIHKAYNEKCDIWSLGVVINLLFTFREFLLLPVITFI